MSVETTTPLLSPVAHQFDDLPQQQEADDMGMWVFLCTEILFFGGMLLAYLVYRSRYEPAFEAASRRTDLFLGTLNTGVLLTSSLTAAMAVHSAESRQQRNLILFLIGTMILGTTFIGVKSLEYYHDYQEHLMPLFGLPFEWEGPFANNAQMFFGLYFVLTGVHALHMMIGLGVMLALLIRAARGHYLGEFSAPIRILGLYWHFVDVIWVFLFPLLYLVGER